MVDDQAEAKRQGNSVGGHSSARTIVIKSKQTLWNEVSIAKSTKYTGNTERQGGKQGATYIYAGSRDAF